MTSRLFFLLFTICALATIQGLDASEPQKGTLTFKGKQITFQTQNETIVFSDFSLGTEIANLKVIKYEAKSQLLNGKLTDISELTLENSDGSKITLVESKPLKVVRGLENQHPIWKLDP